MSRIIATHLAQTHQSPDLDERSKLVHKQLNATENVTIGIVAKYRDETDAYFSVVEALHHAAVAHDRELIIEWISAEALETDHSDDYLDQIIQTHHIDGLLIPGGFGSR